MDIKYSLVVPVSKVNDFILQHIEKFHSLAREDIELIILPNQSTENLTEHKRIRQIPTGLVSPARKRDIGASHSVGTFLVFLDDDSFVSEEYFSHLDSFYREQDEVAVGGPAVTPGGSSNFKLA